MNGEKTMMKNSVINIDIKVLIDNHLSPNRFIICYLLYYRRYSELSRLSIDSSDLEWLESYGFIKYTGNLPKIDLTDLDNITVRMSFIKLIEVQDEDRKWIEFKLAYPRKDGSRPLHNDEETCKLKYLKIIRAEPELHNTVLKAIENETKDRYNANLNKEFRPAWKLMSTYINQKGWCMYLGDIIEDKSKERIQRI